MKQGTISVFFGEGRGKTSAAVGEAIKGVVQGKTVVLIQFLKGKNVEQVDFIKSMEPDIKWFSFEKEEGFYTDLTEEKKQEAAQSIRNGLNFAQKVLTTNEADILILDEVLGLPELGLATVDDIVSLVESSWDDTDIILTGRHVDEKLLRLADHVSKIDKVK